MRRWLLVLLLPLGCTEFDDPSTVKDLRLLAMSAEPSEIILDPAAGIPAIAMTALVADPAGAGRPLAFAVRACGNDPRAPSAPGAGSEASGNYPGGGARATVGSRRCPADGATSWTMAAAVTPGPGGFGFAISLTPEQLVEAFKADLFPGLTGKPHGGFDLGLPISVELAVTAGDQRAAGIKRVIFWQKPLRDGQRPNRNPVIGEVRAFVERDPVTLDPIGATESIAPDAPRMVDRPLWIQPAGAEAEPYVTSVVDRFTDETVLHEVPAETLRYQFFATAGKFVPNETASELAFGVKATGRVPIEAKYEPPAAETLAVDASGRRSREVTLWIVVRDERGGASWTERRLLVSYP